MHSTHPQRSQLFRNLPSANSAKVLSVHLNVPSRNIAEEQNCVFGVDLTVSVNIAGDSVVYRDTAVFRLETNGRKLAVIDIRRIEGEVK